jgi:hypothetical protein
MNHRKEAERLIDAHREKVIEILIAFLQMHDGAFLTRTDRKDRTTREHRPTLEEVV